MRIYSASKKIKHFVICILIVLFSIQISAQVDSSMYYKFEQLLDKQVEKEKVHNVFLSVYSSSRKIDWNMAMGEFQDGREVGLQNPFYTASIGKTFTATAIAVLVEMGKLKFEDKIDRFLSAKIMKDLHVMDEVDYSSQISIAQLLQHTSGLPDYFEGATVDGSPNLLELLFVNPSKFWTPLETIHFAKQKMKPDFAPGTDYGYTDTEFVLLGLIIESVSDLPLHTFFQKYFFQPLGMKNSSMYLRSEPLEGIGKMAEFYVNDMECSGMRSLSSDWAGGGLVSTAADLNRFQLALHSGKIISEKTLEVMKNWIPETYGMYYGFGLRKVELTKLISDSPTLQLIGHSGSTASFMYYCPQFDVYLAGTLNQTNEVKSLIKLMANMLAIIIEKQEK